MVCMKLGPYVYPIHHKPGTLDLINMMSSSPEPEL